MIMGTNAIKKASELLRVRAKHLRNMVLVLIAIYVVSSCVVLGMLVISFAGGSFSPLDVLNLGLSVAVSVLSIAASVCVMTVLLRSFNDIAALRSPFSRHQANRFRLAGVLMVIKFALLLVASILPEAAVQVGEVSFGFPAVSDAPGSPVLDFSSLLWAVVLFGLSYIFQYGTLLQELSDDTV